MKIKFDNGVSILHDSYSRIERTIDCAISVLSSNYGWQAEEIYVSEEEYKQLHKRIFKGFPENYENIMMYQGVPVFIQESTPSKMTMQKAKEIAHWIQKMDEAYKHLHEAKEKLIELGVEV